jgi:nucleotide-binding universal stress UspA family protein
MKTILVPTDFSPAADNAARYALHLAKGMQAGIKLCNAFLVPLETPTASQVVWPLEDYTSVKYETTEELKIFAQKLMEQETVFGDTNAYHPVVEYLSEVGSVADVVADIVEEEKLPLVVMGMSGAGLVSRFVLGSSSRKMIEKARFPVLLVPPKFVFNGIKKIAFATDLSKADIDVINSISGLARSFNAEILIAHITDETYDKQEHQHKMDAFLSDITGKIDYPKIYYRHIKSMDVDHGLDWLTEHGQIDILAMVHRQHSIVDRIFVGSHTQKLARHIKLPLLVFPIGHQPII